MEKILIGKWQSRGGRYWVALYRDEFGFTYRSDNGGGNFGAVSEAQALQQIAVVLEYQPSKMTRV